jgi:hypothetical protein
LLLQKLITSVFPNFRSNFCAIRLATNEPDDQRRRAYGNAKGKTVQDCSTQDACGFIQRPARRQNGVFKS